MLVAHPFGEDLEMGVDPLTRLLAHDVADPDPVVEFLGRDHRQHLDPGFRIRRPHRREPHRVEALTAIVQNNQKLAHVSFLLGRHHERD